MADSLELVPADSQYVGVIDVEQILAGDVPSVVADQIEDDWEDGFDDIGVFPDELTTYVFAYGEDWFLVVLEGEHDFEQSKDDLRAGKGWMASAGAGEEGCLELELQDCRAVGASFRSGDEDYLVEATVAVLFRSDRTAESEMHDLEEAIEDSLEGDIIEVSLEGEFVIVTVSLDDDEFLGSVSPDTGSDAPSVGASDIGDDHGDSADHATLATLGRPESGEVDYAGDVDFLAFTAERGQTYQIDVGLGTLGCEVATLHDSDGWALEFNDDHGGFRASRIMWTATESTVHYVAVEGYGTGSYTLTIAESDTMPIPTPNPTATAIPTATAVPEYACSGGADPTPLHRAVSQANLEVVRILADKCSEGLNVISAEYFSQRTPLSLAIGNGHEEIVRALVAAVADPAVKVSPGFRVGTHLTCAVGLGDAEIVQILLARARTPTWWTPGSSTRNRRPVSPSRPRMLKW